MDRCDTEPLWFLFASCGRPFMFARTGHHEATRVIKSLRRAHVGSSIELREGNYAAATIDELLAIWSDPRITSATDGSYVYVAPHDVMEEN